MEDSIVNERVDKIIEELQEESRKSASDPRTDGIDDSIEIIRKLTKGMVLVPEGWAKYAECPNADCNDGVIPHQFGETEWDMEQCQFCYEKDFMQKT